MAVQLPGAGLAQMLGKVLGKPDAKGDVKGLVGPAIPGQQGPEGPKKGAPIGDGTVLHGAGFGGHDRTGLHKNVHEKETVARFLKDPELDKVGRPKPEGTEDARPKGEERAERALEAKDRQEAQRADVRREDKADDAKQLLARETQREEQQKEREREKERERHRGDDRQQQQDEPEGQAWVEPERERPEDEPEKGGHRDADVLGETHQCKGESADGVRCLRKPQEGSSYCREHVITTGVPRTIEVL